MELETLLVGTKWDILELISEKPYSPIEIAENLGTTIANVSQQLRLLQTAGIVSKKRTGTGKPGKPRMLFSLADNFAFIMVMSNGFVKKKLIRVSSKQKEVLKSLLR